MAIIPVSQNRSVALPRPVGLPGLPALPLGGLRRFAGKPASVVGALLLLPLVLAALAGPWLPLADPNAVDVRSALQAPSLDHPFGTDKLGRDILSRVVAGARISLSIG